MKITETVRAKIIKAAAALIICAAVSGAELLNGQYQITGLTIVQNDKDTRGFNNTGLYISATDKRVKLAGAWRGYPVRYDLIVERTINDTLVLRDADDNVSIFKFHIRNNIITGRHSMTDPDNGTRQVYDTKATVKRLNQGEVDKLRADYRFLGF